MLIKETDAMQVLSIGRRLTIPDVKTESAMLAPLIEAEMERAGLTPAGPWIFIANIYRKTPRRRSTGASAARSRAARIIAARSI